MTNGLIGRKLGMTQVYDENGAVIPVTVVEAGPCKVTMVKTKENDGYAAVQLGLVEEGLAARKVNKPETGHLKGLPPMRHLREFKIDGDALEVGADVLCDLFEEGANVSVSGVSKGKGFQGVIRRHGFGGGRMTHGSHFKRAPGSIGQCATPSRVFPGKKMPGHMGSRRITTKGLKVVKVVADKNLLLVKGAIPGAKGGIVVIRKN